MAVAVTMYFKEDQGNRTTGWSETIFTDHVGLSTAVAYLNTPGNYIDKRVNLLGTGILHTFTRLTLYVPGVQPVVANQRVTLIQEGRNPSYTTAGAPYYNSAYFGGTIDQWAADFSQAALMLRLASSLASIPSYSRTFWLCGSPDLIQRAYSSVPAPSAWSSAYALFLAMFSDPNEHLCLKVVDRGLANPLKVCTAYDPLTNLYTVPAHGLTSGNKVEAIGWKTLAGTLVPRGTYKILVVSADTFRLQGSGTLGSVLTLGGFRSISLQFPRIASVAARGYTNKKKGRPFGALVGRRSNQLSLRA